MLRAIVVLGVAAGGIIGASAARPGSVRSAEALAVRTTGGWLTWWRRNASPSHWDGSAPLADHVSWRPGIAGIEWGELPLKGASEAWRTRLIVVRLDPRRVTLSLVTAFADKQSWTIADAEDETALALDAGQFRRSLPWGWVVSGGHELLEPEYAPLAGAVVVDSLGRIRILQPDSVALERSRGTPRAAFQSYPMLLQNGAVPAALREAGRGVDLNHRDARLAMGTLSDGRVIIALTRFDFFGKSLDRLPFGLTSPEMAAVMGGLGCQNALLLDGGISSQLAVQDGGGAMHSWPGMRSVPLGLVGRSR
jgi:uncharacterized protein YigE (DUF2233 family)